jgi:hypothetical protein
MRLEFSGPPSEKRMHFPFKLSKYGPENSKRLMSTRRAGGRAARTEVVEEAALVADAVARAGEPLVLLHRQLRPKWRVRPELNVPNYAMKEIVYPRIKFPLRDAPPQHPWKRPRLRSTSRP